MNESRLKKPSLHIFFILLSIIISVYSAFVFDTLTIIDLTITYTNGEFFMREASPPLILIFTPIIVTLILFIFRRKHLTSIDIELYGGLSSRFLILAIILLIGYPLFTITFMMIPFYGFIAPVEIYIAGIVILVSNYLGLTSSHIFPLVYTSIVALGCLSIAAFYLYLIFIGRMHQEKVLKIYYIIVTLGFSIMIYEMGSNFAYILLLQVIFVLATTARWAYKLLSPKSR